MPISNIENNTENIQAQYKSEAYILFCLVLFSPSQNSANEIISKTDDEIYAFSRDSHTRQNPIHGTV